LGPELSYATVSTIAADLGNTAIFPALSAGGSLHIISQDRIADAAALSEYFDKHRIDCLKIVPSHLASLLTGDNPKQLLPRKKLILGGEAASLRLIEEIKCLSGELEIYNHYGP